MNSIDARSRTQSWAHTAIVNQNILFSVIPSPAEKVGGPTGGSLAKADITSLSRRNLYIRIVIHILQSRAYQPLQSSAQVES